MSDGDDYDCPLCMEELDYSDRNFRPCPCLYQICRFCYHHIKENLNSRCPACRRLYSEQTVEFTPVSPEEIVRIRREKKEKERQQKEMEAANRKHLSNMRVVQKNLVYVIGLNPKVVNEQILRQHDYFGQYGKISKIVVNKRNPPPSTIPGAPVSQPSVGVYITYDRKEDAAKAIAAVDGSSSEGKILRASYGTTKYCTYYLRNMACQNPGCMYLHEPGEDADSYTKEDLAIGKHHLRDHVSTSETPHKPQALGRTVTTTGLPPSFPPATTVHRKALPADPPTHAHKPVNPKIEIAKALHVGVADDKGADNEEKSALPATASWAKPSSNPSTPVLKSQSLPDRAVTPEIFGPPLAVAAAATQKPKPPSVISKRKSEDKDKQAKKASADPKPASAASAMEEKVIEVPALDTKAAIEEVPHTKLDKEKVEEETALVEIPPEPAVSEQSLPVEEEKVIVIAEEPVCSPPITLVVSEKTLKPKASTPDILAQYVLGSGIMTEDIPDGTSELEEAPEPLDDSVNLQPSDEKLTVGSLSPASGFSTPLASMTSLPALPPLPPLPASTYIGTFNPFVEDSFGNPSRSTLAPAPGLASAGDNITSVQNGYGGLGFDPFKDNETVSISPPPSLQQSATAAPPTTGVRSRHTSRFGFAQDYPQSLPVMEHSPLRELPSHLGFNYANIAPTTHSLSALSGIDPRMDPTTVKSMQDGFRALLPNVNISFGAPSAAAQQAQLGANVASGGGLWNSSVAGGSIGLRDQDFMNHHQLPIASSSTPVFAPEYQYHQTILMQQQQQQHQQQHHQQQHQQQQYQQQLAGLNSGLGGIRLADNHDHLHGTNVTSPPISVKSPPPGIGFMSRMQWNPEGMHHISGWSEPGQQSAAGVPSMLSISPPPGVPGLPIRTRDEAQDFFGQFLKKAAASDAAARNHQNSISSIPFQDPAIMAARMSSPGGSNPPTPSYRLPQNNQLPLTQDPLAQLLASQSPTTVPQQQHFQHVNTGGHRLRVFEGVARAGEEPQGGAGLGVGMGGGILGNGMGLAAGSGVIGNMNMGGYFGGDVADSTLNQSLPPVDPAYASLGVDSGQQQDRPLNKTAINLHIASDISSNHMNGQPRTVIAGGTSNQIAVTEHQGQGDAVNTLSTESTMNVNSKASRQHKNGVKERSRSESPASQSSAEVVDLVSQQQHSELATPATKVTKSSKKRQQHQLSANAANSNGNTPLPLEATKVDAVEGQQHREYQGKTESTSHNDKNDGMNLVANRKINEGGSIQPMPVNGIHAANGTAPSGKKKKKDKSRPMVNANDNSVAAACLQRQFDTVGSVDDGMKVNRSSLDNEINKADDKVNKTDTLIPTSTSLSLDDILGQVNGTEANSEATLEPKSQSNLETDDFLNVNLKFEIPSSIFYTPPPPGLISTPSTPGGAASPNGSFTSSICGNNLVGGASTPTSLTTPSLDELLSKDFGFSLPPFTSSAFSWSSGGLGASGSGIGSQHVTRSSSPASVEALEREVENARREAAMLEDRLKAVINKNRKAMLL